MDDYRVLLDSDLFFVGYSLAGSFLGNRVVM